MPTILNTTPELPSQAFQLSAKHTQKINNSIFLKYGDTIFFFQRNTSIPIPHVIESNIQDRGSWFSITLIPESSLTET